MQVLTLRECLGLEKVDRLYYSRIIDRVCTICDQPYRAGNTSKVCGPCRVRACQECGSQFVVKSPHLLPVKKYCSTECRKKNPTYFWKGKTLLMETRRKMGKTRKERGIVPPSWLGKKRGKQSEEHKAKTVRNLVRYKSGEQHPHWKGGKGLCQKCTNPLAIYGSKTGMCRFCWRKYRVQPTSIEKAVYDFLVCKGILFERQREINGKFSVDAYIPSLNLVIEADGQYWHSLPKVIQKDRSKEKYLSKCGYKILHLKEMEINNGMFKIKIDDILRKGELL